MPSKGRQATAANGRPREPGADGTAELPFDPTNGTVPGERHIVVARGRDYGDVTPFKGVYRGGASTLEVLVDVTRLA